MGIIIIYLKIINLKVKMVATVSPTLTYNFTWVQWFIKLISQPTG